MASGGPNLVIENLNPQEQAEFDAWCQNQLANNGGNPAIIAWFREQGPSANRLGLLIARKILNAGATWNVISNTYGNRDPYGNLTIDYTTFAKHGVAQMFLFLQDAHGGMHSIHTIYSVYIFVFGFLFAFFNE